MHSGHPRARGCWWAQLGSFRCAEQQELGCCEIWGCQRPRFPLVSAPSPSTGQVWWPLGILLQPLHTVPVEQCSHCSWLGNGPNIAPAPWAGRRAHSSTRSLPCLPKAPHSPPYPQPHTNTHSHPISFTQHPMATTPVVMGPRVPGVLQCCPSLSSSQHGDGCGALCPPSLSPSPPATRLCSGAAPGWEQGSFPTCQRCWQQDLGSHLPSCSPSSPGPSASSRQSPTKQSHNLARGPACGKASVQPQGEPGRHPEPVTAHARQQLRQGRTVGQAGKDRGTGQAGMAGQARQEMEGRAGRPRAACAERSRQGCRAWHRHMHAHAHPAKRRQIPLSCPAPLVPPVLPQPRRASSTLPVLHVPTPGRAARPSSPPPVGFGPRCLLAFWQPHRSSDGMCPLFFFFSLLSLSQSILPSLLCRCLRSRLRCQLAGKLAVSAAQGSSRS